MAKNKLAETLNFYYKAKSPGQEEAEELWKQSRILFLMGPAGVGKTTAALGIALKEIFRNDKLKLILSRPAVDCEEQLGFLPGDLNEKLDAWMGPFRDVFDSLSGSDWAGLQHQLVNRMEVVSVGMFRGRTVRNGILILDEAQNCSYSQLKCILTRIGENGRIIICGDPEQSDRFPKQHSPLVYVANKLTNVDAVSKVYFDVETDQVRDPLVNEILERLE